MVNTLIITIERFSQNFSNNIGSDISRHSKRGQTIGANIQRWLLAFLHLEEVLKVDNFIGMAVLVKSM